MLIAFIQINILTTVLFIFLLITNKQHVLPLKTVISSSLVQSVSTKTSIFIYTTLLQVHVIAVIKNINNKVGVNTVFSLTMLLCNVKLAANCEISHR